MTQDEARDLIAAVLAGIAPEAELAGLDDGDDLREALDLDSMDFLNLMIGLNERSGIDIPESDYPELFTLGGAIRYLCARG